MANALSRASREGKLPPPKPTRELTALELVDLAVSLLRGAGGEWASDSGELTSAEMLHAVPASELRQNLELLEMDPWDIRLLLSHLSAREKRIGFYSNQLCERGAPRRLHKQQTSCYPHGQ